MFVHTSSTSGSMRLSTVRFSCSAAALSTTRLMAPAGGIDTPGAISDLWPSKYRCWAAQELQQRRDGDWARDAARLVADVACVRGGGSQGSGLDPSARRALLELGPGSFSLAHAPSARGLRQYALTPQNFQCLFPCYIHCPAGLIPRRRRRRMHHGTSHTPLPSACQQHQSAPQAEPPRSIRKHASSAAPHASWHDGQAALHPSVAAGAGGRCCGVPGIG